MVRVHSTGINTDTKPVPCPCYLNQTIYGSRAFYWDQSRHQASALSMLPKSNYLWLSCTLLGSTPTPSQCLVHVTSIKLSMAFVHSTGINTDTKPVPCPCYLNQTIYGFRALYWDQHRHQASALSMLPKSNYLWLSCILLESAPTPSQCLVHVTSIKLSMAFVHSTWINTDTKPVSCPCYLNQTIYGFRAFYWDQHRHQASALSMLPQSNYIWLSCTLLGSTPTPSQCLVHVTSIKLSMAFVHSTGINTDTKPVPCPCYLNQTINGSHAFYWDQPRHQASALSMLPQSNYLWLSCILLGSTPTPSQCLVHVTSIKLSMALVHSTGISTDTKPVPCPCYLNQTIYGSHAFYWDQHRHQASPLSMLPQSNYLWLSCILLGSTPTPSQFPCHEKHYLLTVVGSLLTRVAL